MTQVKKLFNVPLNNVRISSDCVGKVVKQKLQSICDVFWKGEISAEKLNKGGIKLRHYSTLKKLFSREPLY